jgi:hypothetical protein
LQINQLSRQFREPGHEHVAVPPRGTLDPYNLRYLAFQGVEAPFDAVRFVMHITVSEGHTDGRRDTFMKGGVHQLRRLSVGSAAPFRCAPAISPTSVLSSSVVGVSL